MAEETRNQPVEQANKPEESQTSKEIEKPAVSEETSAESETSSDHVSGQETVDEMHKAADEALESMREQGNIKNDEILVQAKEKLDKMYADLKAWLKENTQPEKVKTELESFTNETADLLNKTREKVIEVSNSEQFKTTMKAGAEFLSGTGAMIGEGFKYGYDKLMEIPEFKKVADKVEEEVDKLRRSRFLANMVDETEKGITELNSAIFKGLKSFFDEDGGSSSQEKK